MSSYPLFYFLSLSHLIFHLFFSHSLSPSPLHFPHSFPLASSSPTLSPHLTTSSPMGFTPLSLHFPHLFISHGFFSHLFISHGFFPPCFFISLTSSFTELIAFSISYFNSPLPTTPTIGDTMLKFFFFAPVLLWWFVYERCNFFPFCSLIRFVDFVEFVITRFVVFIFYFFIGFLGSELWVVVLCGWYFFLPWFSY
jgi:hypothetical protein